MMGSRALYLTFTDGPSGVYRSQVLDVCDFLEAHFGVSIDVVSVVSARRYLSARRRWREQGHRGIVLPMFPGVRNWRRNVWSIQFVARRRGARQIIGRSEFATNLGLELKRRGVIDRVAYDGRSARAAECEEYRGQGRGAFSAIEIAALERKAVLGSDFRIAVSTKLVDHWRERYAYVEQAHAVIPCTLPRQEQVVTDREIDRVDLGFDPDQVVLVYAGSDAEWQSFGLMDRKIAQLMDRDPRITLLLLSPSAPKMMQTWSQYPERVRQMWVEPSMVQSILSRCDHGLLLRAQTTTNRVACPTKFAEYLGAGLDIVISEDVGDLSEFVRAKDCGVVVGQDAELPHLEKVTAESRRRNQRLARENFSKQAFEEAYRALLRGLSTDGPPADLGPATDEGRTG